MLLQSRVVHAQEDVGAGEAVSTYVGADLSILLRRLDAAGDTTCDMRRSLCHVDSSGTNIAMLKSRGYKLSIW